MYPSGPYDPSKDADHSMLPDDPNRPAGPTPPPDPEPAFRLNPTTITPNAPFTPPPPKRRLPVLPLAIALVALLAGGALFMSGYTMGRQMALEPGTRRPRATPSSRSGTRTGRSPSATRAARSTRTP